MSDGPDLTPAGIAARRAAQQQKKGSNGGAVVVLVGIVLIAAVVLIINLNKDNGTAPIGSSNYTPPPALPAHAKRVTAAELGSDWPLHARSAIVACILKYPPNTSIFELTLNINGQLYGLNGTAQDDPDLGAGDPPKRLFKGNVADVSALFPIAEGLC